MKIKWNDPREMGRLICCGALYQRGYNTRNARETCRLPVPRVGWLVGFRVMPEGYSDFLGHDEGRVFRRSGSVRCYVVVFWPSAAPKYVPVEAATDPEGRKPWPNGGAPGDIAQMREEYATNKEMFPRDAAGRFMDTK